MVSRKAGPSRGGYPSGASGAIGNARQEAAPRALLGAQGMTWRAYRAGSKPGRLPLGGAGAIGSARWKVMIWKVEGDDLEI